MKYEQLIADYKEFKSTGTYEKTLLATKIQEQENAIFDLAKILSEVKNGETVSEQNK